MTVKTGRIRVTFQVSPQDTLDDFIDLYEWRDGDWVFMRGERVAAMPHLHEFDLVALIREDKRDEIEAHRHAEPKGAVVNHIDGMLKNMGWRRVGALHTFPLDNPMRPGSTPNRFAESDVRRGWRERRHLAAVLRAMKTQKHNG
jgi:hypothetical protein